MVDRLFLSVGLLLSLGVSCSSNDPSSWSSSESPTDLNESPQLVSAALQSDGKIVVAGIDSLPDGAAFFIVRFNSNGTKDVNFGQRGIVALDVVPSAVSIGPSGEIIYSGWSSGQMSDESQERFQVRQLKPDGSIENNFDARSLENVQYGFRGSVSMAIQSNGKILLGGSNSTGSKGDVLLVRLNRDGSLDSNFGSGGSTTTDLGFSGDRAQTVLPLQSGKIVVGATDGVKALVLQYLENGVLDSSFGRQGIAATSITATDDECSPTIGVQADGRIVALGLRNRSDGGTVLRRLMPDGSVDRKFGDRGMAVVTFGSVSERACGLDLDTEGRIHIVGTHFNLDVVASRTSSQGSVDRSFGIQGRSVVYNASFSPSLLVEANSSSLVFGDHFPFVRVNKAGNLETTFSLPLDSNYEAQNMEEQRGNLLDGVVLMGLSALLFGVLLLRRRYRKETDHD